MCLKLPLILVLLGNFHTHLAKAPVKCKVCKCCEGQCLTNQDSICDNAGCKNGWWGDRCIHNCSSKLSNCDECKQNKSLPKNFINDLTCTQCSPGYFSDFSCYDYCGGDKYQDVGCRACRAGYQEATICMCPVNCKSCPGDGVTCSECKPGFYGQFCENRCSDRCATRKCRKKDGRCHCNDGYYGVSCQHSCSFGCVGNSCNFDGTCTCKPRFTGSTCTLCEQGYYREHCNQTCPAGCSDNTCNKESGYCKTCRRGRYGKRCDQTCQVNCLNNVCDMDSGACSLGCKGNFKRPNCQECLDGKYGQDCNKDCSGNCRGRKCKQNDGVCSDGCTIGKFGYFCKSDCSDNCQGESCNQVSGQCVHGCVQNFTGNLCDQCVARNYGERCDRRCSMGCQGGGCNRTDGRCKCYQYITGPKCDECDEGRYGTWCRQQCPSNCKDLICDRKSGNCTKGCSGNFNDAKCNNCKNGWYGGGCDKTCPKHCTYRRCKISTGYCYACEDNFTGDRCDHCVVGKFGEDCDANCSRNCYDTCNRTSGHCVSCKDNFDGDFCNDCKAGYFQEACSSRCPGKCLDNKCDRQTGGCKACQVGYFRADCSVQCPTHCLNKQCDRQSGNCQQCIDGHFGSDCLNQCPTQCLDSKCDQQSGDCNGCTIGRYGRQCEEKCSSGCQDRRCSQDDGLCSIGCQSGFTGDRCCSSGNCSICTNNTHCQECDIGYYGTQCNDSCPTSCKESVCHIEDGVCLKGCQSGFDGPTCEKVQRPTATDRSVMYAAGASGFFVIVIIVLVVIFRRRRFQIYSTNREHQQKAAIQRQELLPTSEPSNSYHVNGVINDQESMLDQNGAAVEEVATTSGETTDTMLEEGDINEAADTDTHEYYNTTTVVRVSDLYRFIDKMTAEDFQRQFKSLPSGLIKPYTVSHLPANNARNRYKGIYPYDHSRVTIPTNTAFYINACFIDGYKKKQEFIASLGPTSVTTDDFKLFWKMVWFTRSEKIVMLTNLTENGIEKCEQYWPQHGKIKTYDEVQVKCISETIFPEYTHRVLAISKKNQRRTVHHLHFTVWPDKSVPVDEVSLIEFRQKVRGVPTTLNGPTVVHCSAGIGRTGTYVALDILTEEAVDKRNVNVFGCVLELRQQRVNMVQTAKQYEYLHRCLAYMMDGGRECLTSDDIQRLLKDKHGDKQITQIAQSLANVLEDTDELKTSCDTNRRETTKNRKTADIPGDTWRPKLYLNRGFGESNYINAVYIDTLSTTDKIIIAQTPLPETVEDFLTLVYQTEVTCIVSLDDIIRNRGDSIGKYLTEGNNPMMKGSFIVSYTGQQDCGHSKKTTMELVRKTQMPRTVEDFQYKGWSRGNNMPEVAGDFLRLVKDVQQMTGSDDKILVHCLTGGERSGLFCGVYNILEKLQENGLVNIVNTLRQITLRRRNAVLQKVCKA